MFEAILRHFVVKVSSFERKLELEFPQRHNFLCNRQWDSFLILRGNHKGLDHQNSLPSSPCMRFVDWALQENIIKCISHANDITYMRPMCKMGTHHTCNNSHSAFDAHQWGHAWHGEKLSVLKAPKDCINCGKHWYLCCWHLSCCRMKGFKPGCD